MSFADANPYLLIMTGGFFTGFGNVAGQYVWNTFLKSHADKHAKKMKKAIKSMKWWNNARNN